MTATYAGTHYLTIRRAARAWAHDAAPDGAVFGAGDSPRSEAETLLKFWDGEADRSQGSLDLPTEDGETVDIDRWKAVRLDALEDVIKTHIELARTAREDALGALGAYEPLAGTRIEDACSCLVAMAPAFMIFNGVRVDAIVGDTPAAVLAKLLSAQAAAREKAEAERRAFDATPEGQAKIAAARTETASMERAQKVRIEEIERSRVALQFEWGTMGSISGFSVGYEAACRTMLYSGMAWLLSSGADAKTLRLDSLDRMALERAIGEAEMECSGAMHSAVTRCCLYIAANGWDAFVVEMSRPADEKVMP